jgi:hypothetical protein
LQFQTFLGYATKASQLRCDAWARVLLTPFVELLPAGLQLLAELADPRTAQIKLKNFLKPLPIPYMNVMKNSWNGGGEWDAEKFSVEAVNKVLRGFSRR